MAITYDIPFFNQVFNEGFDYALSDATMATLNQLSKHVGAPDYVRVPVFRKINTKKKDPSYGTKVEKRRGSQGLVDEIRGHINKLSNTTYFENVDAIILKMRGVDFSEVEMESVAEIIFVMASTNRFYSEMYANLYLSLANEFAVFHKVLIANIDKFEELFATISVCDSETNYDKFCLDKADNERRKALSAFILNLTKLEVLPQSKLVSITWRLLASLYSFIVVAGKKDEADEIICNIDILYDIEMFKNVKHDGILLKDHFKALSKIKSRDSMYPSLTSKGIFKCMDIAERSKPSFEKAKL